MERRFDFDNSVNRARVARWREKKLGKGYKSFTVYLPPETVEMIKSLHPHFRTRRKNAKLIAMAIKTLYKKTCRKKN
jgi:hypothetical protein